MNVGVSGLQSAALPLLTDSTKYLQYTLFVGYGGGVALFHYSVFYEKNFRVSEISILFITANKLKKR